jgi:hypothetical protein
LNRQTTMKTAALAVAAACAVAHTGAFLLPPPSAHRVPRLALRASRPLLSAPVPHGPATKALQMNNDDGSRAAKITETRRLAEEAAKAVEEARLAEEKASAMRRGEQIRSKLCWWSVSGN